jgi:anti-anti-sigma factor
VSPLADVHFREAGDGLVVALEGEVDNSNAGELRRAIAQRIPAAARRVVVDLSLTTYMDSAGVELVFELARALGARRQSLVLLAPSGSGVRRVLELCDVGSVAQLDDPPGGRSG